MGKSLGRKMYSVAEAYGIMVNAFRCAPLLKKGRDNKDLSPECTERIMLAVTEVNGCALCSYAHTQQALEAGMSTSEIEELLAGTMDQIPAMELPAILFAQHYAEQRGHPSAESWQRIVSEYGLPKAEAILGAIRMIMMGNAYGAPLSSMQKRFKEKKPDPRSSLGYEIAILASFFILLVPALVQTLVLNLFKVPLYSFK